MITGIITTLLGIGITLSLILLSQPALTGAFLGFWALQAYRRKKGTR